MSERSVDVPTLERWLAAWPVLCVVAIANGAMRELTYGRRLSELRAHQLSTVALVAAIAQTAVAVERRAPLPDVATANAVGAAWCGATAAFELGLGRLRGRPWSELLRDYDLRRGRVFAAVPLAMATAPRAARGIRRLGR
jgi:hypothetical protein